MLCVIYILKMTILNILSIMIRIFILFYCDFTHNLLYDIALADVIFRFWVTSQ